MLNKFARSCIHFNYLSIIIHGSVHVVKSKHGKIRVYVNFNVTSTLFTDPELLLCHISAALCFSHEHTTWGIKFHQRGNWKTGEKWCTAVWAALQHNHSFPTSMQRGFFQLRNSIWNTTREKNCHNFLSREFNKPIDIELISLIPLPISTIISLSSFYWIKHESGSHAYFPAIKSTVCKLASTGMRRAL